MKPKKRKKKGGASTKGVKPPHIGPRPRIVPESNENATNLEKKSDTEE